MRGRLFSNGPSLQSALVNVQMPVFPDFVEIAVHSAIRVRYVLAWPSSLPSVVLLQTKRSLPTPVRPSSPGPGFFLCQKNQKHPPVRERRACFLGLRLVSQSDQSFALELVIEVSIRSEFACVGRRGPKWTVGIRLEVVPSQHKGRKLRGI